MRKSLLLLACVALMAILIGRTGLIAARTPRPDPPHLVMVPYIARNPTVEPEPTNEPSPTVEPSPTDEPSSTVEPSPTTDPSPGDGPALYDCNGQPQDATWLYATFGNVAWQPRDGVRLAALRCLEGPASLEVHVEDAAGNPVENVIVFRYWPDAPFLPNDLAHLAWDGTYNRAVYGPTNAEGNIGFGMGGGDYYFPPDQTGASAIWVGGPDSYLVTGLGMLGLTNHMHLNSDWALSPAQARSLAEQSWGFTPGADVRYEDLGHAEPVPIVSWPAK